MSYGFDSRYRLEFSEVKSSLSGEGKVRGR